MRKQAKYYQVAGLTFGVEFGEGLELEGKLQAYEPFETALAEEPLFLLSFERVEDGLQVVVAVRTAFCDVQTEVYLAAGLYGVGFVHA